LTRTRARSRRRIGQVKNLLLVTSIITIILFAIVLPSVQTEKIPVYMDIYGDYWGSAYSQYTSHYGTSAYTAYWTGWSSYTSQYWTTSQKVHVADTWSKVRIHYIDGSDKVIERTRVPLSLEIASYADRIFWIEVQIPVEYTGELNGRNPYAYYTVQCIPTATVSFYNYENIGQVTFTPIDFKEDEPAGITKYAVFYLSGNKGVEETVADLKRKGLWQESMVADPSAKAVWFWWEYKLVSPSVLDLQSALNRLKVGGLDSFELVLAIHESWTLWATLKPLQNLPYGYHGKDLQVESEKTVDFLHQISIRGLQSGLTSTYQLPTQTVGWTTTQIGKPPVLTVYVPPSTVTFTDTTISASETTITVHGTTTIYNGTTITFTPDFPPGGGGGGWLNRVWNWLKAIWTSNSPWKYVLIACLILIGILILAAIIAVIIRMSRWAGGGKRYYYQPYYRRYYGQRYTPS
jgi:hypothetical protein